MVFPGSDPCNLEVPKRCLAVIHMNALLGLLEVLSLIGSDPELHGGTFVLPGSVPCLRFGGVGSCPTVIRMVIS